MRPLAFLRLCSVVLSMHAHEIATLKLTKTIPLPGVQGRFDHFALDTTTGRSVTDLAVSGDTDDLFYDAKLKRLYLSCGEGCVDVIEQRSADMAVRTGGHSVWASFSSDRSISNP